tara:strand:+ start:96 stop:293 length:198 start_codon:yes stop_codon:yes gene_type:complete
MNLQIVSESNTRLLAKYKGSKITVENECPRQRMEGLQRAIRRIEDKRDNRLKTRAKTLTNHGEKL